MFAREGAKVVLVNRSAERRREAGEADQGRGRRGGVFAGDVEKPTSARRWRTSPSKKYGRLDMLHNNVGIGAPGTPETVTLENWNKVLEANLTSDDAVHEGLPAADEARAAAARSSWCRRLPVRSGLMGSPRRGGLFDGESRPARLHPLGCRRLCDAEHPRQLHRRRLGAHADGRAYGRGGARAAAQDGADADRGNRLGHRLWRDVSGLRRSRAG